MKPSIRFVIWLDQVELERLDQRLVDILERSENNLAEDLTKNSLKAKNEVSLRENETKILIKNLVLVGIESSKFSVLNCYSMKL